MANTRQKAAYAAAAAAAAADGPPSFRARIASIPRLVRDVLRGRYLGLSKGRLGMMFLGLLYVLSPVDLIPEAVLPLIGLADDAAVAAWLVASVFSATSAYRAWETGRFEPMTGPRVQPW
jgi:uncharacterized membrane protein YkvA (DUF1232 family)